VATLDEAWYSRQDSETVQSAVWQLLLAVNWGRCSPGLCAGPGFFCHRHELVAGNYCWGCVWPELLHWSGFHWQCLSRCWTAWASCSYTGLKTMSSEAASLGLEVNWQKTKVQALGCREDMPVTIKFLGQDVVVVEEFVYLGCLIHSTTVSTWDISRRSAITCAAMQSLENQIWRSWLATSTKVSCTTRASYQYSCMVRTAGRYVRQMHIFLMHSTSGVCVCCLASNGTSLSRTMMYGG